MEKKKMTDDERPAAEASSPNSGQQSIAPHRLSVLVAEDTPANQKLIRSILERRGHGVTVATNGRGALEQMSETSFDAILMDLQMPVMDGYQATKAIRELERHRGCKTPIIALSANSADRDRDACFQIGMNAFLSKPIDVGELIAVVESIAAPPRSALASTNATPIATASNPAASVIDMQATMRRLGGDTELLQEFIEVFNEETPRLLQQLRSAIAQGDAAAVTRIAHSLRGLAANFDATSVVLLASSLEDAGKQGNLDDVEPMFEQLSDALSRLRAILEPYRSS